MTESIRYLMFLVGTFYFLQVIGGNPGLHTQSLQKFLKESYSFSPAQAATFFAFIAIPWMIKPIYGIISDFLPILGYRRKSYFVLVGLVVAGSYWYLSNTAMLGQQLALLLFTASIGLAFSDVLCDAVMVEKGQPIQATDRLQAAQWTMFGIAGIIIAFFKGYIAQYCSLAQALQLSMIAPLVMILLAIIALKERKFSSSLTAAKQVLKGFKTAFYTKQLWGVAIFLFLFNMSPTFGVILYYYERDILKFSDIFIGYVDTAGSIGFLVGTVIFGIVAKRFRYETLIKAIVISDVIATLTYILFQGELSAFLVKSLTSIINAITFLGTLTVAARACPKYVEATVFAILMTITNIGMQLGAIIGGNIYKSMGYYWLVVIFTTATACMWFFLPLIQQKND